MSVWENMVLIGGCSGFAVDMNCVRRVKCAIELAWKRRHSHPW